MSSVSIVIITRNRVEHLKKCLHNVQTLVPKPLEILVVDNNSNDSTLNMLYENFPDVRIIQSNDNLGIPAGRNVGYREAKGDICVTIDDDATFEHTDAIEHIERYFEQDAALCCVSFMVKNQHDELVRHYIPRRDRRIIRQDAAGAFFVGTGHAMHRHRFIELGGFWEKLGLYFGEEPDLSYRILEAGYHILHSTKIAVIHEETTDARPSGRRIYHGTRNTPWIALKNLPWYSVISLTIFAWGYYGLQAMVTGRLGDYLRGIYDCLLGAKDVLTQRRRVSQKTIALLKYHSGVHWY